MEADTAHSVGAERTRFRCKDNDLEKLARVFFGRLSIFKCEFGGIGLDPKRPFGNGDAESDMLKIIDWDMEGDDGDSPCYASWQRQYVHDLYHVDLIPFLQEREKNLLEVQKG